METKPIFTVIGSDRRQEEIIYLLLDDGYEVNALGFDHLQDSRVKIFTSPEHNLFKCHVLLLPIPYVNREGNINIERFNLILTLEEVFAFMGENKPWVILGKADKAFKSLAVKKGIDYFDIVEDEPFAILNAVPTAEGAIQRAMEMSDYTIHGSKALVLGYGRIGKSLSRMLKGIGAKVTVAARKDKDLAWATESGYMGIGLREIDGILASQQIIFNSIPTLILDRERLTKLSKDTIIVDVSSLPGGIDFAGARELNLRASLDLGLPGKVAPKTAAGILYKIMIDNLTVKEI